MRECFESENTHILPDIQFYCLSQNFSIYTQFLLFVAVTLYKVTTKSELVNTESLLLGEIQN